MEVRAAPRDVRLTPHLFSPVSCDFWARARAMFILNMHLGSSHTSVACREPRKLTVSPLSEMRAPVP